MANDFITDTHSHINMLQGKTAKQAIIDAYKNNVKIIIVPCAYPSDLDEVMSLIQSYENVYGMLGIHPSEAKDFNDNIAEKIKSLAKNEKVVAIGETGLDYYWDKSFVEIQKDVFIKHIKLANELNLPIDIHDREAHKDTLDLLKKYNRGSNAVLHCYSGSAEFAKECLKEGLYFGIGGVLTFKNAKKLKEAVGVIPMDRIILETDAPYLTPVPFRGEENEPAYLKYVAEELAKIKNISVDEVIGQTTSNALKIFKIRQ